MILKCRCNECCVRSHHNEKKQGKSENITSHCDSDDGVCEGNAYTKDNWKKRCCGKHCKVNGCFEIHSLWYVSICIIVAQFNGRRCLLQSNVLINRRYLSLASLLLPMTVAMTLSQ